MDNTSKTAPDTTPDTDAAAPVDDGLSIATLNDLSVATSEAAEEVTDKPVRMYNKKGFKGLSGLDGISNEILAVMAGCIQRQIALNGGETAHVLLGTEKKPGIIAQFGPLAVREAEDERKIESYAVVAKDLGIKRNKGESACDFIARVNAGYVKK